MSLTDVKVKAARVPDGKKQVRLTDSGGLYLQVTASGKYWRMNYRFGGKQKTLSMGVYPTVSLKEARLKRDESKKLLDKNEDPCQRKQVEKRKVIADSQADTFKGVAVAWLEKKRASWADATYKRNKTRLEKCSG
jgi:hypothetical protein